MAANDKKMGQIPTGTWPTSQNAKQLYLKFRLGTYIFPPKRALELSLTFQVARYIKLVREGFEQLKRSFGSVFLFLSYKNSQGGKSRPPALNHPLSNADTLEP